MTSQTLKHAPINPYLVLLAGILAVSTGAIFIRLAQKEDVTSLVIAAGRLSVATLVLTPSALRTYRHEFARLNGLDIGLCVLAGAALALHFATWVTSLEYTSVVASVVLVTTNPLFVALLSAPLLGEKVSRAVLAGIFLAFLGGILVAVSGDAGDPPTRPDALLGNGLAIIGAIAAAVYMLIGRRIRAKLSLVPYIWLVYGVAALVMVAVVGVKGERVTGYPATAYVWLIALGLVPQLLGHSSFNYALGYLPAAYVSLISLGEPAGSGLLAWLFLGEVPALLAVIGAGVIVVGIGLASRQGD